MQRVFRGMIPESCNEKARGESNLFVSFHGGTKSLNQGVVEFSIYSLHKYVFAEVSPM